MTRVITMATPLHVDMLNTMVSEFSQACKQEIIVGYPDSSHQGDYGTNDFFEVMSYKVSMIQEHLQNMNDDTNLIYLDADIHIRQDVVTHMNDELDWSKQDILFQSDDGDPCAGMFVCKNSNGIRNFFVEVYETMHSNREYYAQRSADQTAVFDVLKRGKIKYGFLSDRFTTYGNLRPNKKILWSPRAKKFRLPKDLVAFHANFTIGLENKIALLEYVRNYK